MISRTPWIQQIYDATWGRFIFAGAYDWLLNYSEKVGLADLRQNTIAAARGRTLEIGAGTALNLPYYPPTVTSLILTEPYLPMMEVLKKKTRAENPSASVVKADAEALPFPDGSFDTVVATMVLCSAANPTAVLKEISRVLKTGGQFLFMEHVRHPDPRIAERQDWIQPLWYFFWNGCHCNQNTAEIIRQSPLQVSTLEEKRLPMPLKIVETVVSGRALR